MKTEDRELDTLNSTHIQTKQQIPLEGGVGFFTGAGLASGSSSIFTGLASDSALGASVGLGFGSGSAFGLGLGSGSGLAAGATFLGSAGTRGLGSSSSR